MLSISPEMNGTMDRSQLVQVRVQFYPLSNHQEAFVRCRDLFPYVSPRLADVPQVQQLSRDPRSPPCQRTEQEVLEEVLLHSTEIRPLFLQQGNFQGKK